MEDFWLLDRSVRRWDRTDEPFFLEEEREKRFDAMFEAETQQGIRPIEDANGSGLDSSLKTGATLTAADSIIEALERRDGAAARDALGAEILTGMQGFMKFAEPDPDPPPDA